ncbi:uncharacterized protein PHALS_01270 [Plasmopara halstedii]|uniref:Uncharacterized protein n=1 Tax=Plasmopara halstedii TaxID=4781 RepID=A0A0N7L6Q7_PLAHL|nr:uncharacterized protein PHALS_01270 [Plasmopara halstedii]CEG44947.1 hypothetical protein PHALS_01270 [Plasmopara halstedii]|eukprot:XP_024581316.1 hypothetical protein PHALS_01270 [Plasmopara halstedii]
MHTGARRKRQDTSCSMPTTKASTKVLFTPRRSRRPHRKSRRRAKADGDAKISESKLPSGAIALTVPEANDINPHADDPEPKNYQRRASVLIVHRGRQLNRKSSLTASRKHVKARQIQAWCGSLA